MMRRTKTNSRRPRSRSRAKLMMVSLPTPLGPATATNTPPPIRPGPGLPTTRPASFISLACSYSLPGRDPEDIGTAADFAERGFLATRSRPIGAIVADATYSGAAELIFAASSRRGSAGPFHGLQKRLAGPLPPAGGVTEHSGSAGSAV